MLSVSQHGQLSHPSLTVGKLIHVIRYMELRGEGVSSVDWGIVCLLAAYCGPNTSLVRAMGSH